MSNELQVLEEKLKEIEKKHLYIIQDLNMRINELENEISTIKYKI